MKPTLLILAAGIGSRYGGLKQIEPVGPHGEIVIDYSVYDALRAGFGKLVFVIRREFEKDFRAAVGARFEQRTQVEYRFQDLAALPAGFVAPLGRVKPWGTGHAILVAEPAVGEPFAAINADDFYGRGGYQQLHSFLQTARGSEFALVGFTLRNTLSEHGSVSRGICRCSKDLYLGGVTEMTRVEADGRGAIHRAADGTLTRLTGDEWTSMNMWGFTPDLFAPLKERFEWFLREKGRDEKSEFYIPVVVDSLVQERQARVRVLPSPDVWFGVTYPADKARVAAGIRGLITQGEYPETLWG